MINRKCKYEAWDSSVTSVEAAAIDSKHTIQSSTVRRGNKESQQIAVFYGS